jgi:phosphatidylserine/phosphatidylglycerophosphate/cardiolipin synthase-like enzyme
VLSLIRGAERQIVFQNQYIKITDSTTGYLEDLVEALIDKSKRIEDVRIILRSGSGFWDDVSELKRRGLDVARCVKRLANTHTKGIVVDGRRVLIGSHNWSTLGVTLNRDASLIFDDREVAEYFLDAFDIDWNRSPALQMEEAVVEEGVRVVTDPTQPVPAGYRRMPLSSYVEG